MAAGFGSWQRAGFPGNILFRVFSTSSSSDEEDASSLESGSPNGFIRTRIFSETEDETEPAEVKKIDQDEELRENVDEEKEGKALAEAIVTGMEFSEDSDEEDESEKETAPSILENVSFASNKFQEWR